MIFDWPEIARRYDPLIWSCAWRYARHAPPWLDVEDLRSEGHLGLHRAAVNYRADADPAAFAGYAWRYITGRMRERLRMAYHARRLVPDREIAVGDALPDVPIPETARAAADASELWAAVDRLPEHERVAVLRYYRDGRLLEEIAGELNRTESCISLRLTKARRKLRRMLQ